MFERIKSQMGELMTDDELKALLEKSVHEAFFKPRKRTEGHGYQAREVDGDSRFVELMREQLDTQVEEYAKTKVSQWFLNNPEIFKKAVDEAIAKGFLQVVLNYVNSTIGGPLHGLSMAVQHMQQNQGHRNY